LLTVSRESIEAYCRINRLHYVEDESNQDVSLFRNRLRHELLPALIDYNPQIVARLDALSKAVDGDEALLGQIMDDYWGTLLIEENETFLVLDLTGWRALPLSMRRRALRKAAMSLRPQLSDISFEVTELARNVAENGQSGDQVMLPGGTRLILEYDRLLFQTRQQATNTADWPQLPRDSACRFAVPGTLQLLDGWLLSAERVIEPNLEEIATEPDPWQACINASFADDLLVRTRQDGERLRPLGMAGRSTKVGDIMTNRKIPARARQRWPIVASSQHALWLVGHVLDDRARVQPGDKEALLVRAQRPKSVD
jgi:tRNA(Ile)-lysidine synthase